MKISKVMINIFSICYCCVELYFSWRSLNYKLIIKIDKIEFQIKKLYYSLIFLKIKNKCFFHVFFYKKKRKDIDLKEVQEQTLYRYLFYLTYSSTQSMITKTNIYIKYQLNKIFIRKIMLSELLFSSFRTFFFFKLYYTSLKEIKFVLSKFLFLFLLLFFIMQICYWIEVLLNLLLFRSSNLRM